MTTTNDPVPWPPKFLLNQSIDLEEDGRIEFKEVRGKNPVGSIVDTVSEYVVGFLNGSGGRILWGIRDIDQCVVGVQLTENNRDLIRREVAGKIRGIQPAIDPTSWGLHFHAVAAEDQDLNLYVVEVSVPRAHTDEPFFTSSNEVYTRINGVNQKLTGPAQTAWIRSRLISQIRKKEASDSGHLLSGVAKRVFRLFFEHGVELAQIPRFLSEMGAPFTCSFSDLSDEASLLNWIDVLKVKWMSDTFSVRLSWIEGESEDIHERSHFDRNPKAIWDAVTNNGVYPATDFQHPLVYFLRNGLGNDWLNNSDGGVCEFQKFLPESSRNSCRLPEAAVGPVFRKWVGRLSGGPLGTLSPFPLGFTALVPIRRG